MALIIHVEGVVQGVGFRPFIFRLAQELDIRGWVYNASDGVHILAEGAREFLDDFLREIEVQKPEAATITALSWQETEDTGEPCFSIRESHIQQGQRTLVSPDLAICKDCLEELCSPTDRRYHYPFINCTNCGPRFTIIANLPYDRAHTSMAGFTFCESCEQEYLDPANRRFHAQPNACFVCGPHLELYVPADGERGVGTNLKDSDALMQRCVELLLAGKILAVKGLGGYHLVCDATNEQAVIRLRKRKQRPRKPLAVMAQNLEVVKQSFVVSSAEATLLTSPATPIVLLRVNAAEQPLGDEHSLCNHEPVLTEKSFQLRRRCLSLAPSVASGLGEVGVMLPSTPVQHLLLREMGKPLVMTSGNISQEPIIGSDSLAQTLLSEVADAYLLNNRPILSRYDDSVVRVIETPASRGDEPCSTEDAEAQGNAAHGTDTSGTQFVRRARGYAPAPLAMPLPVPGGHTLLAVGPEQKSTFCLASNSEVFLSQHLGDLANASSFSNYLETIQLYEQLFAMEPTVLACDAHPSYLATKWAHEQAVQSGVPLIEVQHHHAHIAAVIAEHLLQQRAPASALQQEVIGIALDGTGYGGDGTVWGGEVLIASLANYQRFAHLEPFCLPGGAQAIKHPVRAAYALLLRHGLTKHPAAEGVRNRLDKTQCELIEQMVSQGINAPLSSSAGRLFDAVSALLAVCDEASYEGEPAILLEAAMGDKGEKGRGHAVQFKRDIALSSDIASDAPLVLSTRFLVHAILGMMQAGATTAEISRYFHEELMQLFVAAALHAREATGLQTVALSGGVFNNRFIATHLPELLRQAGFAVLTQSLLPPNDGCISYGQAIVACARLYESPEAGTLVPCV